MSKKIVDNKYTEQYKILHEVKDKYGSTSINYIKELCLVINYLKPKVVLDYGCGKCKLINKLSEIYKNINFYGYDPSIPSLDKLPVEKADLVINTDVLEHIPENILPNVIEKISKISSNVFFVLHHGPASNILPNGENAHCTIKSPFWYENLLKKYFKNVKLLEAANNINSVIVTFSIDSNFVNKYNFLIIKILKSNIIKFKCMKYFYKVLSIFTLKKLKKEIKNKYKENQRKLINTIEKLKIYDYINRIDIRNFFQNKNVAIIGNAESIFNNKYGKYIDKNDIIIRFNRGFIKDKSSQGNKTTIWCGSCDNINEKIIEQEFSPEIIIWTDEEVLSLYYIIRSSEKFLKKMFYYNNSFYNELKFAKNNINFQIKKPTTGCRMIDFLIKYGNFKKLSIYGFDFFKTNNFYNNESLEHIKKEKPHDFNFEKNIL